MIDTLKALWSSAEAGRIRRFLLVGGFQFLLDLTIFMLLTSVVGMVVWWAQTISVTIRTIVGFVVHKWFTFKGDSSTDAANTASQGIAYAIQGLVNIPISAGIVTACVWLLGGWALGGKVLSEGVLAVEVYVLYRVFVYRTWIRRDTEERRDTA